MQLSLAPDELEHLAELVAQKILAAMPATGNDGQLMTEPEAAQHCKVAVHTLRDARRRGVLKFSRAGRFPRYSRAQLQAWLETE